MNKECDPILVVDDEPEMCWILEHIIQRHGFACMKATSAEEAIALAERHHFRMAFVDAKLADIDGLELARRLRRFDLRLPVVIVSGYLRQDDPNIEEACRSDQIAAFIGKPFANDKIARALADYASR